MTVLLEACGTVALKAAELRPLLYGVAYLSYFLSLHLFSLVLRRLPLSVAYPAWCALGTIGVTILSTVVFHETVSPSRWGCILGALPFLAGLFLLP